jgi:hypothetical protein
MRSAAKSGKRIYIEGGMSISDSEARLRIEV